MAKTVISTKRIAITKAQAQMVGIVAGAAFISIFCLIASRAVFSTNQYQAKVVTSKEKARNQLQENLESFKDLRSSYRSFDSKNPNILGANRNGAGQNEGNNAKIVLDALPGAYDFPALASSIEKILKDKNFNIASISGADDQLNQQNTTSPTPTPVEIPFSFSVTNASYTSVQDLIKTLEKSIRPMQIDSITLSGDVGDMALSVKAKTYYQPGKSVNIKKETVK